MKKVIMAVLLAGFAFTCHAEISANCNIVLAQSAVTFSKIDEIKEGFTEENPAPQDAVEAFIDAEVLAMVDMYRAGAATLLQGATRDEAEQFITESVAQVDSGVDEQLQIKARQAAVDSFMCGYDDQLKSS